MSLQHLLQVATSPSQLLPLSCRAYHCLKVHSVPNHNAVYQLFINIWKQFHNITTERNNNSKFQPRAQDLPHHGLLTRIRIPGMEFPPVEQTSNPYMVSRIHTRPERGRVSWLGLVISSVLQSFVGDKTTCKHGPVCRWCS